MVTASIFFLLEASHFVQPTLKGCGNEAPPPQGKSIVGFVDIFLIHHSPHHVELQLDIRVVKWMIMCVSGKSHLLSNIYVSLPIHFSNCFTLTFLLNLFSSSH